MSEARIGRIVVAALHQALGDYLPLRLVFYEDYLTPMRMRAGTIGAASFAAALSFLRRENDLWAPVMMRAGQYAADWVFDATPAVSRLVWKRLPQPMRMKMALRLARQIVRDTMPTSRAKFTFSDGAGQFEIVESAFCDPRSGTREPLCGFYVAVIERLTERLGVAASARVVSCRAMGQDHCGLAVGAAAPLEAAPVPSARGRA